LACLKDSSFYQCYYVIHGFQCASNGALICCWRIIESVGDYENRNWGYVSIVKNGKWRCASDDAKFEAARVMKEKIKAAGSNWLFALVTMRWIWCMIIEEELWSRMSILGDSKGKICMKAMQQENLQDGHLKEWHLYSRS
jgi:hypothetical protein